MTQNKITEMEIEEIKKELQANQRSHLEEREEERLEHQGTIRDREQKLNTAFVQQKKKWKFINKEIIQIKRKNLKYVLSGDTNSN